MKRGVTPAGKTTDTDLDEPSPHVVTVPGACRFIAETGNDCIVTYTRQTARTNAALFITVLSINLVLLCCGLLYKHNMPKEAEFLRIFWHIMCKFWQMGSCSRSRLPVAAMRDMPWGNSLHRDGRRD